MLFSNVRKPHMCSLTFGVCIGILVTISVLYMPENKFMRYASYQYSLQSQPLNPSANYNGEETQANSSENSYVSKLLYNKVRVLCWIMTNPGNIKRKAIHVNATWGKRCNVLLFMSSKPADELKVVALNVSEGREHLWSKTRAAFSYIYDHHLNEADWFLKADDDTYTIMENLRYFLKDHSPAQPVFFGRKLNAPGRKPYMSGGGGYVLSKAAVLRAVTQGFNNSTLCYNGSGSPEDVELGRCLLNLGVTAGDSRDELGRERFHLFSPESQLIPGMLLKNTWYLKYSYYPPKEPDDRIQFPFSHRVRCHYETDPGEPWRSPDINRSYSAAHPVSHQKKNP